MSVLSSWSAEVLKMDSAVDDMLSTLESDVETLANRIASWRHLLQHHGLSEHCSSR